MKISLNHIRYYRDQYNWSADPAPDGVDGLVERIGAQLGAVEEVENLGEKYRGALIARVVHCRDHTDSDHLHVCLIDDGGKAQGMDRDSEGLVQVVCGAPNVHEGLTVVWLPPGATVPESAGKDPFVLEARSFRGEISNGMLASARELALGDNHDGILEIDDPNARPGDDFAATFGLNDHIINIENKMFTHRPDCFGMIGVAREIAGIQGQPFTSPDWYRADAAIDRPEGETLKLTVTNELPAEVPRFTAVPMSNITVKPSPLWLQINLLRLGVRPVSNIVVDLTNYYMLLTGQPLHAYDYDKVRALTKGDAAEITVRNARPGEKIALLNGKTVEPRPEAIMIASGDHLIGIGGVMGGADTEVDDSTRNIILECATFDMYSIRRTAMAHGLFTDAVTRFNKGQSPLQNLAVLAKVVDDIRTMYGGKVAGELIDVNQAPGRQWVHPPVPVTTAFVNERLGLQLTAAAMQTLLENVEFQVAIDGDMLTVTAPFWRTDIELREDVVEEIGRLYGFDKLPLELPKRSIKPVAKNTTLELKQQLRAALAKAGANEVLTYSFVHGDLLTKAGQDPAHAFQVDNALSPDLQYYRLSVTPSLLGHVHRNVKAGYDEFALFELGKGHIVGQNGDDGLPREDDLLAVVIAAADRLKKPGAPYYAARTYLTALLPGAALTFKPVPAEMQAYDITKPYDMSRSAAVYHNDTFLGLIGEFRPAVTRALKLPAYCAGFELDTLALGSASAARPYAALPRFPKVTQDITLQVAADLSYQQLLATAQTALDNARPEQTTATLQPLDIYQSADDTGHKRVTLRLEIASYQRTLTDAEVARLLDALTAAVQQDHSATRV